MNQESNAQLLFAEEEQVPLSKTKQQKFTIVSRDEMNLAEFPITVLSTRVDSNVKTLEFSDTVRGKNGEVVTRKWIITGADKFGLPTASDDEVLLGLLKLTVDSGFNSKKVYFTRYELLRILRWSTEGRSYSRLQNALDRLSGVRIKASNAFFDNESKSHSTRNFGIIDGYEINDGRDLSPKPSFFTWSEVLFKSFQTGFIKKLDLDFFLELKSAVSKRLYRYLDKHFWYRATVIVNLFTLAHEKIGISRNYKYASSIRQQIDPALDELKQLGFISGYEYEGRGDATTVRIFAASGKPRVTEKSNGQEPKLSVVGAEQQVLAPANTEGDLILALEQRGIRRNQATKLLAGKSQEQLSRIVKILEHFDKLVSTESKLVSRSPIGFLYRAVENPERFALPEEQKKVTALKVKAKKPIVSATVAGEGEYLVWRKQKLDQIRSEVEPELVTKLTREVETALVKLKGLISASRFEEAIRHGVDEKLAALMAVPDFSEWRSR